MRLRHVFGLLAVALGLTVLVPQRAEARDRAVYLNGVRVGPSVFIRNQGLTNVDVRFDANGDIWMTSRGYRVQLFQEPQVAVRAVASAAEPIIPAGAPRRYFLTWKGTRTTPQYDFDVVINGQVAQKVGASDAPAVIELTRFVQPGENSIQLIANKNLNGQRLSASPSDEITVMIDQGVMVNDKVVVETPILEMHRSAVETDAYFAEARFRKQ